MTDIPSGSRKVVPNGGSPNKLSALALLGAHCGRWIHAQIARGTPLRAGQTRRPVLGVITLILRFVCLVALGSSVLSAQELLREVISREHTLQVGGVVDAPDAVAREFSLFVGLNSADPYRDAVSREISVLVATESAPEPVTGLAVNISSTGEIAVLDWSRYSEISQHDVSFYRIYRSNAPFTDISSMTAVATVRAGTFTYTFEGLPAFQDQYFAVVAVDVLGHASSAVNYAASYVLAPEAISREYSLLTGGSSDFPQAISREVALINATAAAPDAVSGLKVQVAPTGETAILDWSAYPELQQHDVVLYRIYRSNAPFTQIDQATLEREVGAGTTSATITGLPAFQDQYFAVVAVDALGNANGTVTYAASYVLAPEAISREVSVLVGGLADPSQPLSREVSLLVPDNIPPAPVTGINSGFTAIESRSTFSAVNLDWSTYNEVAQGDVKRYLVYFAPHFFDTIAGLTPLTSVPAGTLRTTVTGLASRGIYFFAVVAEDYLGNKNPVVRSVSAQATVAGVGDVRNLAVATGETTLVFTWDPPENVSAFLNGYRVYFGGTLTPVLLPATAVSYEVTQLAAARGYPFRITTVDVFGNESAGASLLAATLLPNPTGVVAHGLDRAVRLTWNLVTPAELVDRYAVYFSTSPITSVSGLTPAIESTTTSVIIPNLTNGVTYYFAVATQTISGGISPSVTSVSAVPMPDLIGPQILDTLPAGSIAGSLSAIDVRFSEPIAPATFTVSDARLTGPFGPVTITSVAPRDDVTFRISFIAQTFTSSYTLRVGPQLTDLSGNAMNQDGDGVNGEGEDDVFVTTLALQGMVAPDLTVENVQVSGSGNPGSTATVTWRLHNLGNGPAIAPWTDQISLSRDGTVGNVVPVGEFLYAGAPLSVGAVLERTFDFVVPVDSPAGEVRAVVRADLANQLVEINEANNAALSVTTITIPARLRLTLSKTQISESDGASAAIGTIQRNGDLSAPLLVRLTSTDLASVVVPLSVTIPAGQSSATFLLAAVADSIVDGTKRVEINASAPGFAADTAGIDVLDANVTAITLTLSAPETTLLEGDRAVVTVQRSGSTTEAMALSLYSTNPYWMTVPSSVTIPAGADSVQVEVIAPQNLVVESDRRVTINADASGAQRGSLAFTLVDDDSPLLILSLAESVISESDGTSATYGTVVRDPVAPTALTVLLTNSNPGAAIVPATITIPAGQREARFNLGAINNTVVDGDRVATIAARVLAGGTVVAEAEPVQLTILDDDGPRLVLDLPKDVVGEGLTPAVIATVSRPSANGAPLIVNLTSSSPTDASAPATVTIPANSASTTFPIITFAKATVDGSRTVTFRATTSDGSLAPSEDTLIVSDEEKPDLIISTLVAPTAAASDTFANITFRIANEGLANAVATEELPWVDRVYLSKTGTLADAVLAGQQTFTSTLSRSLAYERGVPIRIPREPGDYFVIVETNADQRLSEITRLNNLRVSTTPIHVTPAYSATVQAGINQGLAGQPVIFTGRAIKAGGNDPAASVLVNIHLLVRGTKRILSVLTDAAGDFRTTWTPLPGEGGHYQVGAAHPGVTTAPIQDEFTLLGVSAEPKHLTLDLVEASTSTGTFQLTNLADVSLSGLAFTPVGAPGGLTLSARVAAENRLGPLEIVTVTFTATAATGSAGAGNFVLRITSTEGVSYDLPIAWSIKALQPRLRANVDVVEGSMLIGEQRVVPVTITNSGGAPSGPLAVLLPNAPWLHLSSPAALPSLAAGESATLNLLLTPAATLPLTVYNGSFVISGSMPGASLTQPFSFRAVSNGKGSLTVAVQDEFTFFTEAKPNVAGATVTLRDPFTAAEVRTATTPATGKVTFADLPAGYYAVEVGAEKHAPLKVNVFVEAGEETTRDLFISYQAVRYNWTVTETEIQDRYKISVESVFETNVPVPVVVVEPGVIDVGDLQSPGQALQVDLKFTNHGLIAVNDLKIVLPTNHPCYRFTPLTDKLGTLGAKQSITIPVLVERLDCDAGSGSGIAGISTTVGIGRAGEGRSSFTSTTGNSGGAVLAAGSGGSGASIPCIIAGSYAYSYPCGPNAVGGGGLIAVSRYVRGNCVGLPAGPIGGGSGGGSGGGYINPVSVSSGGALCPCKTDGDLLCGEISKAFEIPGVAKKLVESIAKKAPSWVKIGEPELSIEGKGKLCLCCIGNQLSWSLEGEASVKLSAKVTFGQSLSYDFSGPTGEFESASGSVSGLAGVETTLNGSLTLSGKRKCGGGVEDVCVTGSASLDVFGGIRAGGSVSATSLGVSYSGSITGTIGVSGGARASVRGCVGKSVEFSACWSGITGNVSLTGTLKASTELGALSKEFVFGNPNIPLVAGTCAPEGLAPALRFARAASLANAAAPLSFSFPSDDQLPVVEVVPGAFLLKPDAEILDYLRAVSDQGGGAAGGTCAKVKIRIDQEAVMTRSAFEATLELENGLTDTALTDIRLDLAVTSLDGAPANDRFARQAPRLSKITAIDGSGSLSANTAGSARWIIVPNDLAAPAAPTQYRVGGTLRYRQGDQTLTIALVPATITVRPDAALTLKYFHQRDVVSDDPFTGLIEPSEPYTLAVLIQNSGAGAARNLSITSAQPQIVDNEKGLLIDFQIIASESVDFTSGRGVVRELTPSLTVNFGEIAPGGTKLGRWLLTSSLQGLFVDYKATFEHLDALGDTHLSLIKATEIHELIRQVEDGQGAPVFLVNDQPDVRALPDTVHLSDGSTAPVTVVETAVVDGPPSEVDFSIQLTATLSGGWSYLRVPDPANGHFRLVGVTRSDGRTLPVGINAWVTDRTFIGLGRRPIRENILHLADFGGTGRYTLTYSALPAGDSTPPVSAVAALPAESYVQIPLTWSGTDAGGLASYDVYVSQNGGAFTLWKEAATTTGALYVGEVGSTYAFYTRARDFSGNLETAPSTPDAVTTVTQINLPPVLDPVPNQTLAEGLTLSLALHATDPNPGSVLTFRVGRDVPAGVVLSAETGQLSWSTTTGFGGRTYPFEVQVFDNGEPRLGAIRIFDVAVTKTNSPPVFAPVLPQTVRVGQTLRLLLAAADPDLPRQTVTYALVGLTPAGLTVNAVTGELSWTPAENDAGRTVLVRLSATDNGDPIASSTIDVPIAVLANVDAIYDQWQRDNFTTAQLADPAVSGAAADPNNNQRANLLEYALGQPALGASNPEAVLRTYAVRDPGTGSIHARLLYRRRTKDPLLTYRPEVSSDRQVWASDESAVTVISVTPVSAEFEEVVVEDRIPVTLSTSRFFQLKVSRPALNPGTP